MRKNFCGTFKELEAKIGRASVGRPSDKNPPEITIAQIMKMAKVKCAPALVIYTIHRMCNSARVKKQTKSAKIEAAILKLLAKNERR